MGSEKARGGRAQLVVRLCKGEGASSLQMQPLTAEPEEGWGFQTLCRAHYEESHGEALTEGVGILPFLRTH